MAKSDIELPLTAIASAARAENDVVAELARSAAATVREVPGAEHLQDVILPPGHEHLLLDLERYQATPRRKQEHVRLHEAGSFADYVGRHRVPDTTTLYADLDNASIVAVLDDSAAAVPGWGQHRAKLELRRTKPWEHWTSKDGESLTQEEFAEHIEQGLPEIVSPPAAEMFTLAQTFQATIGTTFRQQGRLADGKRAFHFEEQIEGRAGDQADIEIPREFRLQVAPFEGGPEYDLVARLRFKVREVKLTLSYHLVRPEDVLRGAFGGVLDAIEKGTGIVAFRGTPPLR